MAEQRYKIGVLPTRNQTPYTTTSYLTVTFRQLEIVNIGNNVYQSLVDNNVGNALTDTSKWMCLVDNDAYIAAEAARQESFNESQAARTEAFNEAEAGRTETFNENEAERQAAIDAKLAEINAMEFDDVPTEGSNKAVKSGGIYNVIENINNVIGSVTYDTKLISSDFSTQGYYKIDGNSIVFGESENWKCKIVDITELLTTNAVGVVSDWSLKNLPNIPPIIYLSGADPIWDNYLSCEYGTTVISGTNLFTQLNSINIPHNATHAIINNSMTYGGNSTVTYMYGKSIRDDINEILNRCYLVDKNGNGNFTTISDAIANTNDGDTIIVNSGTYEEDVHMWGKTRHIVGVSRETCILTNGTGNYLTPPLEANIGSIENMTIIADNYSPTIPDPTENQVLPSYGIHVEYQNATPYTLTIRNCKIVSKWCAGVGIGLRYNQTVEFIDCDLISECVRIYSSFAGHWVEMGGLFFHNDNSNNVSGTGKLFVRNTRLQGKKAALVMEAVNKSTMVDAEFACNTLISEDYGVGSGIIYRYDNMVTQPGYLCGNKITLGIASHGNNIEELNA